MGFLSPLSIISSLHDVYRGCKNYRKKTLALGLVYGV